ncbi:hypothetical protein [Veillonella sp. 3310]|uniref:hypothetical protein n=1 Tax=Veillonella sp. 3310 TaxID=2490956 RepID=UPI0013E0B355|nr:hypothetical protein [Veillonella sp. 3310]
MKGKYKYVANVIAFVPLLVKVRADDTEEAIEKIRKKVHKQIDMEINNIAFRTLGKLD